MAPLQRGCHPWQGATEGGGCSGAWYSVGRVNYSLKDRRVNDSVLGLEYDAGCWIARVVAMRISTGRSEATTRLGIQLELTGFSRSECGIQSAQGLEGQYPRLPAARRAHRRGFAVTLTGPPKPPAMTESPLRRSRGAPHPLSLAMQAGLLAALMGSAYSAGAQGRVVVRTV